MSERIELTDKENHTVRCSHRFHASHILCSLDIKYNSRQNSEHGIRRCRWRFVSVDSRRAASRHVCAMRIVQGQSALDTRASASADAKSLPVMDNLREDGG